MSSNTVAHAVPYGENAFIKNSKMIKKVALSFDDGPHPRYTREILSILSEYQIAATFFVIGVHAERYPGILSEILAQGSEIGNHTFSHQNLKASGLVDIQSEISRCQAVIRAQTGISATLFRPPEGGISQNLQGWIAQSDLHLILWSIDTLDWAHTPSKKITQSVLNQLGDGDVILMHDYTSGVNTTCEALRQMIPEMLARGYEFVTVSELISGDT